VSPLYDDVGRQPMTDADLEAAIEQYKADHPGEPTYAGIEGRLRRLNREAWEVEQAHAAGTTVWALRQARTEREAALRAEREHADLEAARRVVAGVTRGGPPPDLDRLTIERIRAALDDWSGAWPPSEDTLAEVALGVSDRRIRQVIADARPRTSWRRELDEASARRSKPEVI
jgi:hypothetical protein